MMYKEITIDFDHPDNFYALILGDRSLTKTASNMSKEISDFIASHQFDPKTYVYVLINAVSADEYYGPNNNGDGFPEYYEGKPNLIHDGSDYGYKTFEIHAKLYKHHINKDQQKAYGDVLLSIYNDRMHRVELIVRIDRSKAPMEAGKAENGEIVSTSMGAKVPYDVCSICGNKAKTRNDYCYHLKSMMGKVLPDGRKVYAVNPLPKFFDISMVFVPADSSSRVMRKLAEDKTAKVVKAEKKQAEITKEVPAENVQSTKLDDIIETLIHKRFSNLEKSEIPIPRERIDGMCKFPLKSILSTLALSGIMPKPQEFQRIILIKINKRPLADTLDDQNVVFNQKQYDIDPDLRNNISLSVDHADSNILDMIRDLIPMRSRWQPHLLSRIIDPSKLASEREERTADNLLPIMLAVSGLYSLFKEALPHMAVSALAGLLGKHPVIAGGVAATNIVSAIARPLLEERTYSLGTQSAADLLKLSSAKQCLDGILAKKVDLCKKDVETKTANKIYSFGRDIFKPIGNGENFAECVKRAMLTLPLLSLCGNHVKIASITQRDCPGYLWLASTLAGQKVTGLFKNANEYDPLLSVNADTVDLLYSNGKMMDIVTLVKLSEGF